MTFTERIQKDFTTLTLALIPIAIVINIVVGQIVALLKLPVYVDSLGTMLVAILAGPLAGALAGVLTNVVWGLAPPPIGNPPTIFFAGTALVIGLVTGLFADWGWFKRKLPRGQAVALVLGIGVVLTLLQLSLALQAMSNPEFSPIAFIGVGLAIVLTVVTTILAWRRTFPPLVVVGGVLLGILCAIISAPIAAVVFGGVTGGGTDLLVALFEASGLQILQANLAQDLFSNPFDKFVSYIVVWVILRGMSKRLVSQFPRAGNVMQVDNEGGGK